VTISLSASGLIDTLEAPRTLGDDVDSHSASLEVVYEFVGEHRARAEATDARVGKRNDASRIDVDRI